jgi:hypothetical protein
MLRRAAWLGQARRSHSAQDMTSRFLVGALSFSMLVAAALPACGGGGGDGSDLGNNQSSLFNCVPEGSPGNSNGVGKYCSKGGLQCNLFSFAKYCTVDFKSNVPAFCTNQCNADSDCGDGAVCATDATGSGQKGCTPVACMPKPDAGTPPPDQTTPTSGSGTGNCASLSRCCAQPGFPATSLDTCSKTVAGASESWCDLVLKTYELEGRCSP